MFQFESYKNWHSEKLASIVGGRFFWRTSSETLFKTNFGVGGVKMEIISLVSSFMGRILKMK